MLMLLCLILLNFNNLCLSVNDAPTAEETSDLSEKLEVDDRSTVCKGGQADIVFLLDASGSVGADNFQKMRGFVQDVINNFNIGPLDVQVGVDTFSSSVKTEFYLNSYNDNHSATAAVGRIVYTGGGTNTGVAIKYMREHSFTASAGGRQKAPNIAIVVTDGKSSNRSYTAQEASYAHNAGITMLAVGVGSGFDSAELNSIASDPDSQNVYTAQSFDALQALKDRLSSKACKVAQTACVPNSQADIVFILDSSASISSSNYQKMLAFVKDMVGKFDVGQDKIRVGVEIFSDGPSIQFYLNKCTNKDQVMTAVEKIPYIGRATNTSLALEEAGDKMFTTANGDRPAIPNIAIVITDGWSNYPTETISAAKNLRDKGVNIFAIGVGSGVDQHELQAVATDPTNIMQVENFNSLAKIVAQFAAKTCAKARNLLLDRTTRESGVRGSAAGDGVRRLDRPLDLSFEVLGPF